MKLTAALLTLSLVANALLAVLVGRVALGDEAGPAKFPDTARASSETPPVTKRETPSAPEKPAQLRAALRQLGFSDAEIRRAVRAMIEAPRLARERALRVEASNTGSFWKDTWGGAGGFSAAHREELRQLKRAERDEMIRLFGPDAMLQPGEIATLGFLPPDKARRVAAIEHDYADLRRDLDAEGGTALTSEARREREKLLAAEQERDLAALLSPEERQLLAMRDSETAQRLRSRFEDFGGSDAEYRAIFAAQKAFDEKYPALGGGAIVLGGDEARSRDQNQLREDLRAALGAERFDAWQRTQRPEHQALMELQRRANLPPETIAAVAQIPARTGEASVRILNDPVLSAEQKNVALRELAARARGEVRAALGSELGDAYNTASSRGWLDYLERGMSYANSSEGGIIARSTGVRVAPPPAPKR